MTTSTNDLKCTKLKILDFLPGHFERDIWTVKILENEAIFRCTDNNLHNEGLLKDEPREHVPLLMGKVIEVPLMLFSGEIKKFHPDDDLRKQLAELNSFSYEKINGEVDMYPANSKWIFIGKFVKEFKLEDDYFIEIDCRNTTFYLSPDQNRELNIYKEGDMVQGSGFPYLNLEPFVENTKSLSYF